MSGARDALPYRPCVGIMLVDAEDRVFVARRIDMPSEAWQMPQGGIDRDEAPRHAALRELREEIGTDKAEVLAESVVWRDYDLPPELFGMLWQGRYRGQTQRWFLMRFTGRDDDVDLDTEEPEFFAWKWVERAEVPELIVPFKRQIYRDVIAEFEPVLRRARRGS